MARPDPVNLDNGLRGVTRLGIDTAPLIYLIENDPRNDALVLNAIQRITSGQIVGITSVITLSEVLVRPFLAGDAVLQQRYRDILLHSAGFRTCSIDSAAAERAADLRARYGLRLRMHPDRDRARRTMRSVLNEPTAASRG